MTTYLYEVTIRCMVEADDVAAAKNAAYHLLEYGNPSVSVRKIPSREAGIPAEAFQAEEDFPKTVSPIYMYGESPWHRGE